MKVFECIIDRRVGDALLLSTDQCGFVNKYGISDVIHAPLLLIEKHREKQRGLHITFFDLEKAFDCVSQESSLMSQCPRRAHRLDLGSLRQPKESDAASNWLQLVYRWQFSSP